MLVVTLLLCVRTSLAAVRWKRVVGPLPDLFVFLGLPTFLSRQKIWGWVHSAAPALGPGPGLQGHTASAAHGAGDAAV